MFQFWCNDRYLILYMDPTSESHDIHNLLDSSDVLANMLVFVHLVVP